MLKSLVSLLLLAGVAEAAITSHTLIGYVAATKKAMFEVVSTGKDVMFKCATNCTNSATVSAVFYYNLAGAWTTQSVATCTETVPDEFICTPTNAHATATYWVEITGVVLDAGADATIEADFETTVNGAMTPADYNSTADKRMCTCNTAKFGTSDAQIRTLQVSFTCDHGVAASGKIYVDIYDNGKADALTTAKKEGAAKNYYHSSDTVTDTNKTDAVTFTAQSTNGYFQRYTLTTTATLKVTAATAAYLHIWTFNDIEVKKDAVIRVLSNATSAFSGATCAVTADAAAKPTSSSTMGYSVFSAFLVASVATLS